MILVKQIMHSFTTMLSWNALVYYFAQLKHTCLLFCLAEMHLFFFEEWHRQSQVVQGKLKSRVVPEHLISQKGQIVRMITLTKEVVMLEQPICQY
jgi:hypothetical protein